MEETDDDAEEEHDSGHFLLLFKADVLAPLVCNYIQAIDYSSIFCNFDLQLSWRLCFVG